MVMNSSSDTRILQITGVSSNPAEPLTHSLRVKFTVDDTKVDSVFLDKGAKSVQFLLEKPFDLHSGSILVVYIREKHRLSILRDKTFPSVHLSLEKLVLSQDSEVANGQFKAYKIRPKGCKESIWLNFTLPSSVDALRKPEQTDDCLKADIDEALEKLSEFGTILERLGWGQYFLDTGLKFGAVVNQLHPLAGAIVGCLNVAYEKIKDQNKGHEKILKLAKSMARTIDHVRTVEKIVKLNTLKKTLEDFPGLMKETVELIKKLVGQGQFINLILSAPNNVKIDELRDRHTIFMEEFDRGVKIDEAVKVEYLTNEGEMKELGEYLSKGTVAVEPVAVECIEGTRTTILADAVARTNDPDGANIIWIHGAPGSGKSSISISTKFRLRRENRLITYFRFDRNQASTTTTLALWQHIALALARKLPSVRTRLLQTARDDKVNLDSPAEVFNHLIMTPLSNMTESPSEGPLVVVVDGLDECGGFLGTLSPDRQALLQTLRQWSELSKRVPIKLLVTSREEGDIYKVLSNSSISTPIHIPSGNNLTDDPMARASKDASDDLRAFLKHRLKQTAERLSLDRDWPGNTMITDMTHRAAGNFMWAVTATTFIHSNLDPNKGLELIMGSTSALGGINPLYSLYSTILETSFGTVSDSDAGIIQIILGVMIYAKRPLSDDEYTKLTTPTPISPIILRSIREGLRSVIVLESDLRFVHKSFDDFLLSTQCPRKFTIDEGKVEYLLAQMCISTMDSDSGLRFNICNLETSYLKNVDVPDFDNKVKIGISRLLSYSCRFWADHLIRIPFNSEVMRDVTEMLLDKLLYWFEAMSLLKEVNHVSHALLSVLDWSKSSSDQDFLEFIRDARQFFGTFIHPIAESAPHIYISALPFAPEFSRVVKRFFPQYPRTFKLTMGKQLSWSSCVFISEHHKSPVVSVGFSSDEKFFVSGSGNGTICICDSETGGLIAGSIGGEYSQLFGAFFDPNSRHIWSNHGNGQIICWDIDNGSINKHLTFDSGIRGWCKFSCGSFDGGRKIVSVDQKRGEVILWSAESGEQLQHLSKIKSGLNVDIQVAHSLDGRYLAWTWRGEVGIRDLVGASKIQRLVRYISNWVSAISFSIDGLYVVTGHDDGSIMVWNARTLNRIGHPLSTGKDRVNAIACLGGSGLIVSGTGIPGVVMVWNASTQEVILGPLRGHTSYIRVIALSQDGRRVLSGSDDGTVRMWDLGQQGGLGADRAVTDGSTSGTRCVAFTACGQRLGLLGLDGTLRVRDLTTNEEILSAIDTGVSPQCAKIAFSPDGRYIVVYSGDILRIWNADSGDLSFHQSFADRRTVSAMNSSWIPARLAFRSTDHRLITCSKLGVVRAWYFENGSLRQDTSVSSPQPISAGEPLEIQALSPDGLTVFVKDVYGISGRYYLWSTITCQPLPPTIVDPNVQAFALSSSRLVSKSSDTLHVRDIHTGEITARHSVSYLVHHPPEFSPDNCHIAYSQGTSLFVWNMRTGRLETLWTPHNDGILSFTFSPDGKKLVSIAGDGQVRIWDTTYLVDGSNPPDGFLGVRVRLRDGWIMDDQKRLLFWVPKDHRAGLAGPRTTVVIDGPGIETKLDFAEFRYGENWAECFDGDDM